MTPPRRATRPRQRRVQPTPPRRLQAQERRRGLRQASGTGRRITTARQARQGRFSLGRRIGGRRINRPQRVSPRWLWRRGFYAYYVPWYGAVFWPYAYGDLFFFTFWPYAYDDAYWAYVYDDFFDSIFFPYGPPYVSYAYSGPYDRVTTRRSSRRSSRQSTAPSVPGEVSETAQRLCGDPAEVTGWPFERIEKAVKPTGEQHTLLANVKRAAEEAAERLKKACPDYVPLTPTGRLATMVERLQATLDAVKLVRPPLETFYASLDDEQRKRFDAIGPSVGRKRAQRGNADAKATCAGEKAGLTAVPIERIEAAVSPTGEQATQLIKLREAIESAVQQLEKACPDEIAQTPVARLDAMQKRLEAMIEAANTVRPALEAFYASLSDEQKARMNRIGRGNTRSRGG